MSDRNDLSRLSRRGLLTGAGALGLSVSFLGSVAFAASDTALARKKLIVLVCRGGMDGLSTLPPMGDTNYRNLRGDIAVTNALKLDGTFGLHPSLSTFHGLVQKGHGRVAPAIATNNHTRSHFESQDTLESGVNQVYGSSSGWLNRTLQAMAPSRKVAALALGAQMPLILRGKIEATTWSPKAADSDDERLIQTLSDLYKSDPLLGPALATGVASSAAVREAGIGDVRPPSRQDSKGAGDMAMQTGGVDLARQRETAKGLAKALATLMAAEHGPSIAAMSLLGFDTHIRQKERMNAVLAYLDGVYDGLQAGLGARWNDTAVIAITEFGRTAHVNGNAGTDHGTATVALLAGGAVKGGGIIGDWPTLAQPKLYENRDLAPTLEVRSLLKGVLMQHLAIDKGQIETLVFPDSARMAPVGGLIA